ncbi:nicotinic acid mononucleotide adenyltransferase [Sinomicrobium sp. M5D2P17]
MKNIKLFLGCVLILATVTSCSVQDDYFDDEISLNRLLSSYDLWYVDIHSTAGNGEVPFLQNAFTISLRNGTLYANNNLAGIGSTGNGFGIDVGYYDVYDLSIVIDHDIDGQWEFEVYQSASNEIELYNRYTGTSYFLIGYQRSNFDYDKVFYENIHYFLQEYEAWEKTYTARQGDPNIFDEENFLQFLPDSRDIFWSSKDRPGTNIDNLFWAFKGQYEIFNVSGEPYLKVLTLDYESPDNERFELSVIDDRTIELYHIRSGSVYQFTGRRFIQYLRPESNSGQKTESTGRKREKIIDKTIQIERQSESRKIKVS